MFLTLKRCADICLALFSIIASAPFVAVYALYVFIMHRVSPFLIQERSLSALHPVIRVYKLKTIKSIRSEKIDSSNILVRSDDSFEFLPLGRLLRSCGFDELPQMINVLKGEMSIIGPRPLLSSEIEMGSSILPRLMLERQKLNSKPGITGYWQVFGNKTEGLINLLFHDLFYENNRSAKLDTKIFFMTLLRLASFAHQDSIIERKREESEANVAESFLNN
ncbi:MAG: sugar transferase [Ignavibacteriaceae bacterium]|nr:sugar transferase [Ignavibacteriaceae bacterium]